MNESEKIKQEIIEKSAELTGKVDSLKSQAREMFDPATQIQAHPLLCLGLSVGAGFIVGSQLSTSRKVLEPLALSLITLLAGEIAKKYSLPIDGCAP